MNTAAARNNLSSKKNQQRLNLPLSSETNGSYANNFKTLNSEDDDGCASASAAALGDP